jgi:MbtH protein
MAREEDTDNRTYNVVVNHEEQYSIWLADAAIPAGWRAVGKTGQKAECLAYIAEVWTDMRPLSLRKQMAEDEARTTRGRI